MTADRDQPQGALAIRTVAMPADTNPSGDIFGGWLLAQMDIAGGICAARRARGRIATVGVEAMSFHQPVLVGDELSCYTVITRVGRTSITVRVVAWVQRQHADEYIKVTAGDFTYVAIGLDRAPRPVPPEG